MENKTKIIIISGEIVLKTLDCKNMAYPFNSPEERNAFFTFWSNKIAVIEEGKIVFEVKSVE